MGRSRSASWSPLPAKRARPTDAGAAAVAPHKTPQKRPKLQAPPKGGRRGAALIAAAGVKLPPPKTRAASRSPGTVATPAQRAPPRATPEVDLLASQVLPLKLKHLEDLFLAFQTVYGIARSRGLRTTYTNLRQGVQEAWGKRFLVSHVAQLLTLLPDTLSVEWVRLPITPRSKRTAPHLLITLLPSSLSDTAVLRTTIHRRLAEHLLRSYQIHVQAGGPAPHAHSDDDAASQVQATGAGEGLVPVDAFRAPYPDAVPDVPQAELPPPPGSAESQPTASLHMGASALLAASSGSPAGAVAAREPVKDAAGAEAGSAVARLLHQRRLSFLPADVAALAFDADAQDRALLQSMPEELRRRSLDGIVSMDTLRALQANEHAHRRRSSAVAHDVRAASASLGELPRTFTRLRHIFGTKGPNAMKLVDVVRRVREGGAEMTSAPEVVQHLHALAEHAPEFVKLKPWGSCGTPAVWIDRGCDGNAVMARLRKVAEGRRASAAVALEVALAEEDAVKARTQRMV